MTTTKAKAELMQGLAEWLRERAETRMPLHAAQLRAWADAVERFLSSDKAIYDSIAAGYDRSQSAGQDAGIVPAEYTYKSTQATNCATCGERKHTPLRIDAMGGYVCLTCIDTWLGSLLGEFGAPPPTEEMLDALAVEVAAPSAAVSEGAEPKRCGSYCCKAAATDGILCADGECDIESGVRSTPAPEGQGVADTGSTPGEWFVRKRERNGEVLDCFVAAPDCQGMAYDAEILGDDEYRDGIDRKMADCNLIVNAVRAYRVALAAQPVQEVVAPAAQVPMSGWRPIETAPKDGMPILLWEQYSNAPFVGGWSSYGKGEWIASHEHVDAFGDSYVIDKISQDLVTHWAPLPPNPAGIVPPEEKAG